jgi:hypothetical protein
LPRLASINIPGTDPVEKSASDGQSKHTPEPRLSPSEKLTLKHLSEAELLKREMD